MDGKHTPGPWAVGDYNEKRISYPILTGSGPMKGLQQPAEAGGRDESEALSNANLIAAAPDLLEACKYVVRWHRENDSGEGELYGLDHVTDCIAAIRKAEGGAS